MAKVYDFDNTVYDGDSSRDFFLFSLKNHKSLIRFFPLQSIGFILMKLKLINKEKGKSAFFSFVKGLKDVDREVLEFWKQSFSKIKPWYIAQKSNTDIIISASPDFLLNPLKNLLDINLIIASPCNKSSGIFYGKNCYGKEKVSRFKTECPEINIEAFYSDSVSDKPMKDISGQSFLVYGDKIVPWNSD